MMVRVACSASSGLMLVALQAIASAQLVSEGPDGLIYQAYANEGQANAVHTVPDFSRSGYRGGGVAIPFVPAAVTLAPSGGDDTTAIRNAIDAVSALPPGPSGFRGAVLLTAGEYSVSSTLAITTGGVVIRGAGQQDGGGTRITYTATNKSNLFEISGSAGPATTGGTFAITDSYVPVGSRILNVTNASGFTPGDLIQITNLMNQKWIDDIGMNSSGAMGSEAWTPGGYQLKHFRYIESVNGNELTLDAPLVQTIEDLYGGGVVQKATWTGALENVGIEGIRMESTYASDTDENHGWYAITMQRVRNGWVRQVTSRYFGQGLVSITGRCKFVTVEDCAHLDPKSTTAGGNRYSFSIDDSSYLLVQRCLTRDGRHDFASGSQTPGPNAFVDGLATSAQNDIGPHHRYATGQIYDNIKTEENPNDADDAIRVQNRTTSGSGHGWAGAQILFWNCDAPEIVCDAPVGAMNWAIGNVGLQAESNRSPWEAFGIWESHNNPVLPRSLYYAQLRDRLGGNAVRRVTLPLQGTGTLWTALKDWDGDGLLLDPLIAWADAEADPEVGIPLALHATIRDLRVLDGSGAVSWSQISGPGTAVFADSATLQTTATFDEPGSYLLELSVSGGGLSHATTITVAVGEGSGGTTPPTVNLVQPVDASGFAVGANPHVVADAASTGGSVSHVDLFLDGILVRRDLLPPWEWGGVSAFFDDDPLQNMAAGTYTLEVVATDDRGLTAADSITISVAGDAVTPAMPLGLSAMPLAGGIHLDWDEHPAADPVTYQVYRRTADSDFGSPLMVGLTASGYLDPAAVPGVTYHYVVTAVDANGNESAPSDAFSITATLPATTSFDFGTDPGKVTAIAAGFGLWSGGDGGFNDRADGLEAVAASSAGFGNLAFLRAFPGLGGGQRRNFTLTAEVRVNNLAGNAQENNDRWGIHLFGSEGNEVSSTDGISAQIQAKGDTGAGTPATAQIGLRLGPNGSYLASADWVGGAVLPDDAFRLVVNAAYLGETDLSLAFTVSRLDGSDSQTIRSVVSGAVLEGGLFGGSLRIKNERAIEYDNFSVALASADADGDHIDDDWERLYFDGIEPINGSVDSDGDGVLDFFEYLYGSSPVDPADSGFRVEAARSEEDGAVVFTWHVKEGFVLGTHYQVWVSTGLDAWDPLPVEHYSIAESTVDGRTKVDLDITHDYGDRVFVVLAKP